MKTVFVTGASRGIGKSIALELGKDYQVIVGFGNSKDKAEEVVEEIKKSDAKLPDFDGTATDTIKRAIEYQVPDKLDKI